MNPWEERWQARSTPWDLGGSPPVLASLVERDALPHGRVLVPGCGAGWDVFELASGGREVVGLDLAPSARTVFEAERDRRGLDSARARIEIADFFTWPADEQFDLVWDHTFFCALPPDLREQWARRMQELVRPGAELVTLVFPVREPQWPPLGSDPSQGPPYPVHPDLYRRHLGPGFEELELAPVTQPSPGRRGLEWLGRWRRREVENLSTPPTSV